MDFETIVQSRYATKKFDGRPVPEGTMRELYELIGLAATSYNFQPYKVLIVTDAATKKKLAPAAYNQAQIESCSHLLVFCADTDLEGRLPKLEAMLLKSGKSMKDAKAYIDMLAGFTKRKTGADRLSWAQRQLYLALGNALNGAKALGLDSCPMEGADFAEIARILKLPANLVPTTLCPVGYAADVKPARKIRLPLQEQFVHVKA